MLRASILSASVLLALLSPAGAEVLHNIEAFDELGDIKAKYPNATFTRVKAAWVKQGQDFFRMEGPGFPGALMLAFSDTRLSLRKQAQELTEARVAAGETQPTAVETALANLASAPDDTALTIEWVRWVPTTPIPFQRYRSRYGEPTKCDYEPSTMQPFCSWEHRGLVVSLSDNRQEVLLVDATFTEQERRHALQKRWPGLELRDGRRGNSPGAQPQRTERGKPDVAPR